MAEGDDEHAAGRPGDGRLTACVEVVGAVAAALAACRRDEIDRRIQGGLESICAFLGAVRGRVLVFNDDTTRFGSRHEWCADGVEPLTDRMQDLDANDFPWWMNHFRGLGGLVIGRVEDIPGEGEREKRHLEVCGVRSSILVPFGRAGALAGFMAFDSVDRELSLPGRCMSPLAVAGSAFVGAIERATAHEAAGGAEGIIKALGSNLPGLVYRVTVGRDGGISVDYLGPDAHDLVWLNGGEADGSRRDPLTFVHEDDRAIVEKAIRSAWDDPSP